MSQISIPLKMEPDCTRLQLIAVRPGQFTMGSNEGRGLDDWTDTSMGKFHVVMTKSYWLGVYPVTQCQWKAVMGTDPSSFKGNNLPVENISWQDTMEFCKILNMTHLPNLNVPGGYIFRPPTEAEWEYACKAGLDYKYQLGETIADLSTVAWYRENIPTPETQPVGQKKPNNWGLYDMLGNVMEWCFDSPVDYPAGTTQVDWIGELSEVYKGFYNVRGGCAFNSPYHVYDNKLTCSARVYATSDPIKFFGFRLCLGIEI